MMFKKLPAPGTGAGDIQHQGITPWPVEDAMNSADVIDVLTMCRHAVPLLSWERSYDFWSRLVEASKPYARSTTYRGLPCTSLYMRPTYSATTPSEMS